MYSKVVLFSIILFSAVLYIKVTRLFIFTVDDSFNLKCHVMDFKVKSQLLPLLFSGGMAAAQAQTVLQQDTHMFREGDVILKQEVQYKSPGRSGKNVVWDFSELTPLENEYRESYDRMDSLFTCSGMNATYQYRFSGDSLLCVGYFNQLLQMRHLLPELLCIIL